MSVMKDMNPQIEIRRANKRRRDQRKEVLCAVGCVVIAVTMVFTFFAVAVTTHGGWL